MTWEDNPAYCRSLSDQAYLLTWAYNSHGTWFNAWAPRQQGQRRGKHLGSSYERRDLELVCERHFEKSHVEHPRGP